MPNIITYNCDADTQVLDKTNHLTVSTSSTAVEFIEDVDSENPTLILSASFDQDFNYVYIDTTGWYYYQVSRVFSKGHYVVGLQLDRRMSFHSEIENLNVVANRSYSKYNLYQVDDKIPRLSNDLIKTQPFAFGFGDPCYVLAVNGG